MLLAPFLWIFCEFDEKVLDNLSLAQWSNLGFWPDLVNILNERLNETLSLVPTTRDVFAKRQAIEFTLWLLACLGALGLSVRVLKQR